VKAVKWVISMGKENYINLTVRLKTSSYMNQKRVVECRELTLLRKRSNAELGDLFVDAEHDIPNIQMHNYEDGIYTIDTCNHQYDYETGKLDDYDLCLVKA